MEKNKAKIIIPVFLSFFVMSFVDLVGIGVDRAKLDFELSDTLAQLIPSAAFLWFFLLSVPVGVVQENFGKKKTLTIGILITTIGLFIPFMIYTFPTVLLGFALLGIGNTVLQVAANPLLVDVVADNRAPSALSFSQFIKSIGSLVGAPLAGVFAVWYGNWKLLFLVFGTVSLLSALWLGTIHVKESYTDKKKATLASSFQLLKKRFILSMVICIFLVVGIDVGVNATSGQFLINKLGMEQATAESGRSIYFFGKMLGTFGGAVLLTLFSSRKFLISSSILSIFALVALILNTNVLTAWIIIFIIGLGVANIFPLVFSIAVKKLPERSNEIAGLMMMAISGGAVIPLLIGSLSDTIGITFGMLILLACITYIFFASLALKEE